MAYVALCTDKESVLQPELIGLAGENLGAQKWLDVFTSAEDARAKIAQTPDLREVWVASCSQVAPINLAATLKADNKQLHVCMLSEQESGSLKSRSTSAGIDASLSPQAFASRYAKWKQACGLSAASASSARRANDVQVGSESSAKAAATKAASNLLGSAAANLTSTPHGATQSERAQVERAAQVPSDVPTYTPAYATSAAGMQDASSAIESAPKSPGSPSPLQQQAKPASANSAFILPIVSGSGGCGKSSVALMASLILQSSGLNTLLIDFDLQFGDIAQLLGEQHPLCIDEALEVPSSLLKLKAAGNMPALLAAPTHVELAESIANKAGQLIDSVAGSFDVIVANTGSSWAEQHAVLLERCTKAAFLIDQRQTSLAATKRALDLCARCGIAQNPFVYVLNGCAKGAPLTSIDVSCALRGASVYELADGGPDVEDLLSAASPFELIDAGSPFVEDITKLLSELLPEEKASKLNVSSEQGGFSLFRTQRKSRKKKRG